MKAVKLIWPIMIFYPSVHSDWLKNELMSCVIPIKAYKTQFQIVRKWTLSLIKAGG